LGRVDGSVGGELFEFPTGFGQVGFGELGSVLFKLSV